MQSEHTALPWAAVEINHDLRHWQIVHYDDRRSAHYAADVRPVGGMGDDLHEANASLIVRAVNAHEELVEALRQIAAWSGDGRSHQIHELAHDLLDRIDQERTA